MVGYNQYTYVGNNPTTWDDPTGQLVAGEYASTLRLVAVPAAAATARYSLGKVLARIFAVVAITMVTQRSSSSSNPSSDGTPARPQRPPRTDPPPLPEPDEHETPKPPTTTTGQRECNAPVGKVGTHRELSNANKGTGHLCNAHHIIQHAAVNGYIPGYSYGDASAIIVTKPDHEKASDVQRRAAWPGRGTYAKERRVAVEALLAANMAPWLDRAMRHTDGYFRGTLGVTDHTPTRNS